MKNQPFFPQRPKSKPIIYEVDYTKRAIEERMKEHYPTLTPAQSWKVELAESAIKSDGYGETHVKALMKQRNCDVNVFWR